MTMKIQMTGIKSVDIDEILKKDGKDWTREERMEISKAVKNKRSKRNILKAKRKELRDGK